MSDLHARLTAAIDQAEATAHDCAPRPDKVPGMENWVAAEDRHVSGWWTVRDRVGAVVASRMSKEDATHAARWDPAAVLRGLAEDRDILQRHAPIWIPGYSEDLGHLCRHEMTDDEIAEIAGRHGLMLSWDNCPDALSLLRRHGIDPEATT